MIRNRSWLYHRFRCQGCQDHRRFLKAKRQARRPNVRLQFAWYDMWIGAYWDRKHRVLYICPIPTVVIEVRR